MLAHPAFARSAYRDAILASNPLRYYRGGDTSGAVIRDLCGTNDLTITGTPTRRGAPGPVGIPDAAGLRTTNGGGAFASGNTTALPSTAYTLAAWVLGSVAGVVAGVFGCWQGNVGATLYRNTDHTIGFAHRGSFVGSSISDATKWHMAVGTWDGSNARLYVDGVLVGGPTANGTAPSSAGAWAMNTLYVGGVGTGNIITGTVAEATLWARALPLGEIAFFHALGSGR